VQNEVLLVFGEKFNSFRNALEHAHKSYKISKAKLIELFNEHHYCFDTAIISFHETQTRKLIDKKLRNLCIDFALQHKQNSKLVMPIVELYCNQDNTLTIEMALAKVYQYIIAK